MELFRRIEGYTDVTAGDGEIESLLQVLFEEEGYLGVTLLLEVADDGMPAEASFAEYFFDFEQIFLLESHLEKVVGVVDLSYQDLALSRERMDLVLHEEGDVHRLFDTLEGT